MPRFNERLTLERRRFIWKISAKGVPRLNLIPASPVLHRELLVAARSKQTHRLRFTMGLVALVGPVIAVVFMGRIAPAAGGGKDLLTITASAAYFYCLAMGFSLTLTAIREERDQGTLSLLFLTSLRGTQIVFAKLFARSLRTFEGLLAIMPVFALSLLLGGVTMAEFARVCVALLNTLFVSACLGMYISSKRLQLTAAAFLGISLTLALGVVAPFLAVLIIEAYKLPTLGLAMGSLTSGFPLLCSEDASQGQGQYPLSLVASFLVGAWFLVRAIHSVRSNWQDKPNQTKKLRRLKEFQNWDFKSGSRDPNYRAELLDQNPICWFNCRDRFRSIGYWLYLFISYGILAFGWILIGTRDTPLPFWWFAALMFDFGIKAKLNQAAGIQLVEERRLGSLEMILCAPMGLQRILSGLWMALRRQFFRVLATATAFNFVIMLVLFARHGMPGFSRTAEPKTIFWVFVYYTIINISNWMALAWMGTWFGLRNKPDSPMASFGMVRIMARPWLFIGLGVFTIMIFEFFGFQVWRHISGSMWILFGAMTIVVSDIFYIRQAKAHIPRAFQLAATGVLDEPVKAPEPSEPVKPTSILVRLWRRKWLRWGISVSVILLATVGNHWKLTRDYAARLAELRTQGIPTSRNELAETSKAPFPPTPSVLMGSVYSKASPGVGHESKEFRRALEFLSSNGRVARERRVADVELLRAFVSANQPILWEFESTVRDCAPDFEVNHFAAWPFRRGLHDLLGKVHCATLLAVRDRDAEAALKWISLAHSHLTDLQKTDIGMGNHYRRMHLNSLLKTLKVMLAIDLVDHDQLKQLQDMVDELIYTTPGFFVRQIDIFNAQRIEGLNNSDSETLLKYLILVPPSRIAKADMTLFQLGRPFGGMQRAKILRLDAALTARQIAADPSAAQIEKLRNMRDFDGKIPLAKAGLDEFSYLALETYRQLLTLRVCATAIAAERYRLDHDGGYPTRVDELFPLYLKPIPVNPIDGKPLKITPTDHGCIISADHQGDFLYKGPGGSMKNVELVIER